MRLIQKNRIQGWLLLTLILLIGFGIYGCGNSSQDAAAISPDGRRLTNVELMFVTRGSLEGEIGPNG